jgi:hypothetical protein
MDRHMQATDRSVEGTLHDDQSAKENLSCRWRVVHVVADAGRVSPDMASPHVWPRAMDGGRLASME